jgi:hypothetical protein
MASKGENYFIENSRSTRETSFSEYYVKRVGPAFNNNFIPHLAYRLS